jgi:hypothetical protein
MVGRFLMKIQRNSEYIPSYKHLAWLLQDHPAYTSYEKEDSRTRYVLEEFLMNMQQDDSINKEAKDKMMRIMVDFLLKLEKLEDNTPEYRRISLFLDNFFTRKICHCTCASSEDGEEDEEEDDDGDEEDDEDEDDEEEDSDDD